MSKPSQAKPGQAKQHHHNLHYSHHGDRGSCRIIAQISHQHQSFFQASVLFDVGIKNANFCLFWLFYREFTHFSSPLSISAVSSWFWRNSRNKFGCSSQALDKGASQFWTHDDPWKLCIISIIVMISIIINFSSSIGFEKAFEQHWFWQGPRNKFGCSSQALDKGDSQARLRNRFLWSLFSSILSSS